MAFSLKSMRRGENRRCTWTRAVKYACTPLCFPLAWDKNCNNFFGRGSPLSKTTLQDCYTPTPLLVVSRGRKTPGASRKRRLLLFTYSAWLRAAPALQMHIWQLAENTNGEEVTRSGFVTLAARVMLRSFITSSNAAVSSACFWLCKAIFSLNFRGLFEVAMFRSSAPFFLQ